MELVCVRGFYGGSYSLFSLSINLLISFSMNQFVVRSKSSETVDKCFPKP